MEADPRGFESADPTGSPASPARAADGSKIVFASVRDGDLEIYTVDPDGGNVLRQTAHEGAAALAPHFHPDGKRIIFVSDRRDPASRDFDRYPIGVDGTGPECVTTHPDLDGFPMFSHDGRQLVFESNRRGHRPGETNVLIADWAGSPGSHP